MTRYLPVRNKSVDLRQLIEAAGHHLDETADLLQLTSTRCCGYLLKQGSRFRLWRRRWFVFSRATHSLVYYTASDEKKAKASIGFADIQDVFVDHMQTVKSPTPQLTFCLKTRARTYFLVAPNAAVMRIWIDVFITGAEGYSGFI